jgi:outer membrane protein assembly factor BamB
MTVFFATTLVYAAPKMLINLSQWEYNTQYGLHQTCCAAMNAYDVDHDGHVDIIIPFRKDSDRVMCVNGQTGAVKWIYPPMDQDGISGDPMGSPCIGDMDGDGKEEVLFTGRSQNLYCVDAATGAEKFVTQTGGKDEAVCLYDVTGDGMKEAVFAAGDGALYCVDYMGNTVWQFQMTKGASAPPNAFDIDGDGLTDVLCGDGNGNFYCVSNTGAEKWRFETGDKFHHHQPVIADFNGDGEYEIVVHSNDRYMYCLTFYGTEIWRFGVNEGAWETDEDAGKHEGGVAAADLDGDGDIEIVTTDVTGMVHCVDGSGMEVWSYKCPNEIWTGVLICDFTGDGMLDVIVCAEGQESGVYPLGMVGVFSYDGKLQYVKPYWHTASTPSVGDFDGDGEIEGIFQAWSEPFFVLSAGGAYNPALVPWGYKYKTPSNNGVWSMNEGLLVLSAIALVSFGIRMKRR